MSPPQGAAAQQARFLGAYCETVGAPFTPEVIEELQLHASQVGNIHAAAAMVREPPANASIMEARSQAHERIRLEMTPPQLRRYEELCLQYQGALCALLRPSVAAELGLSRQQSEQLLELYGIYRRSIQGYQAQRAQARVQRSPAAVAVPGIPGIAEAINRLAEMVLTHQQLVRLERLKGKPLHPVPAGWRQTVPLP